MKSRIGHFVWMVGLAACGGAPKYYLPTDTEVHPFVPPAESGHGEAHDDDGDWNAEEPAAPTPANAPAPEPAESGAPKADPKNLH